MPTRKLPDRIKQNARQPRSEMTDAELRLWYSLRRRSMAGHKFRRQHPIGPYIVDFYCPAGRLVVELDGGQHDEQPQAERDAVRTEYFESRGLRVLRFSNLEALNETDAVLEVILEALTPSP